MSQRKLYVCTNCHEFWSSASPAISCPGCGSPVCPVEQDYDEYSGWTQEEKKAFKENYVAQHDLTAKLNPAGQARTEHGDTSSAPADSDFWIGGLDTALNITLVVFVLLAVVAFGIGVSGGDEGILIGLVSAVVILVAGFLTVAGMKIFIGMAKDLKAIRRKLDA
jgi:hypothetical protein